MSYLKKAEIFLPPLSLVFLVFKAVQGLEFIYYLFLAAIFVMSVIYSQEVLKSSFAVKNLSLIVLFASWAALTALWSYYPSDSIVRSLFFLFVSGCSFVTGFAAYKSDDSIFGFLLPANVVIVIISLLSLVTGAPENSWTGGNERGFMGFFVHQNTLASLLLFTLPPVVAGTLGKKLSITQPSFILRDGWFGRIFLFLLLAVNVFVLLLSHSRTSILCSAILIVIFITLIAKRKREVIFGLVGAAVTLIVLYFSFSPVKTIADNFAYKGYADVLGNRMILWEPSLDAAAEGGFTGIGYGVSHPEIFSAGRGSHYEGNVYVREKGNSVLALFEETGLTGVFLFMVPLVVVFMGLLKKRAALFRMRKVPSAENLSTAIVIASIIAVVVHAQFEGWWAGPGSVQLPLYFMILGCAVSLCSNKYGE